MVPKNITSCHSSPVICIIIVHATLKHLQSILTHP